jgi:hypothetical protein
MTPRNTRRRSSDEPADIDTVAPANSVEWPDRSHFSEFDAAIKDGLESAISTEHPPAISADTNPALDEGRQDAE